MSSVRRTRPSSDRPSAGRDRTPYYARLGHWWASPRHPSRTDNVVTVPQFRGFVMLHTRGPLNLAAVAAGLDVNPSNASRTC